MDVYITMEEFECHGSYYGATVLGAYASEDLARKELEMCAKEHGTTVYQSYDESSKCIAYCVYCRNDLWNDEVNVTERLFKEHLFKL